MLRTEPPAHLSEKAKDWWRKLSVEYPLQDSQAQLLLSAALTAWDRAREARAILRRQGLTVTDGKGKVRAHPMCSVERDAVKTMTQCLRDLHLDLEPLAARPGRRPGDSGGRTNAYQTPPPTARTQ